MNGYVIEVYSRKTLRGRRWFFRMQAPNGEIILQSQAYKREQSAIDTARVIQTQAAGAALRVFA